MPSLTQDMIVEYREAFSIFDPWARGVLPKSLLGVMLRSVGTTPTNDDVQRMVDEADEDGSGTMTFLQFLSILCTLLDQPDDQEQDVMEAFSVFDRASCGHIRAVEYRHVLRTMGVVELDLEDIFPAPDRKRWPDDSAVDYRRVVELLMAI